MAFVSWSCCPPEKFSQDNNASEESKLCAASNDQGAVTQWLVGRDAMQEALAKTARSHQTVRVLNVASSWQKNHRMLNLN